MTELLVVGGGKMGEALVGGLLAAGAIAPEAVAVVEPVDARRAELAAAFPGLSVVEAPVAASAAVVAVKPHQVVDVCRQLGSLGVRRILSIAVGVGAAAIAPGSAADEEDLVWAEGILGAVGTVVRVGEADLDAVTGVSGSGPAYVFLIAEALIDGGVLVGLARATAADLVVQTLRGAAELLATGTPPAELRAAVTSPGGTTAAALRTLEQAGVRAALIDAVAAATARAGELG
jgi:pyrroline-5-carboxylate reductase